MTGRLSGGRDVPLTAAGRQQARRLAARVAAEFTIDAIYASPLSRSMETARCIGRRVGLEPIPYDALRERGLGRLEGMMASVYPPRQMATAISRAGGETTAAFRARTLRALRQIVAAHPGRTVAVVSHGGPLAISLAAILYDNTARWAEFVMNNGTVTVVSVDRTGATLHQFNALAPSKPTASRRTGRAPTEDPDGAG